jgi:hypothetical protein
VNANQLNALFRKKGLRVLLTAGDGYYYWRGPLGVVNAPSVYVFRAEHIPPDEWLKYAREADALAWR